jgi:antirestriction protein ArdC
MSHTHAPKTDIHQDITNNIIEILDQVDLNDYQPPFAALAAQGLPKNPITNNHYQGVNILALWFNQQARKFGSNHWATFKQWQEKGANVRKGEKGSRIIFYKTLIKSEENSKGEQESVKIPMLRLYTVFNASQVEGYEHHEGPKAPETDMVERISLVDEFCQRTGVDIRHEESEAFYNPVMDFINMPDTSLFLDTPKASATENYYATLLHELTHWTGAGHRLDRLKPDQKPQKDEYAFEELIAELGAAFLCAQHGVTQTPRESHALYIKSWLRALKDDKTYIFKASAQAAKAVEFLNELQTAEKPEHKLIA